MPGGRHDKHHQDVLIRRANQDALQRNVAMRRGLGARLSASRPASPPVVWLRFAKREVITHAILGRSARTRWEIVLKGSTPTHFRA